MPEENPEIPGTFFKKAINTAVTAVKFIYNRPRFCTRHFVSTNFAMKKTYQDPLSKSQIITTPAEETGLSRKEVSSVLDTMGDLIQAHVKPRSCGVFRLPGMFKISVVKKPATKARKGVPNPFRPGETMDIAAKPASRKVKILPLKNLKDMAS